MANWVKAQREAAKVARWAVTMTKVRIRQVIARTRWQLVTFLGPAGGESRGVVDMLAIRKDHGSPPRDMKKGDKFRIVLIQVKGGGAAKPTDEDARRLRAVARHHGAHQVLLAEWRKGRAARFLRLRLKPGRHFLRWAAVRDVDLIFR